MSQHMTHRASGSGTHGRRLAGLVALCCLTGSGAVQADGWDWSVTPYLWAINTKLTTAEGLPDGGGQSFGDIVDKLDFAAQLHFEGRGGAWGFFVDATTLHTSDRVPRDRFEVKTDATTNLFEAAGMFSAGDMKAGGAVDLLFGVRVIGVELDLTLRDGEGGDIVAEPSFDETLTDPMFGVRYRTMLGEKWNLVARADAASGDTDFTANAALIVGRQIGERGTLRIAYRYLDVQFERGDDLLDPSLVINGPMIGYTFSF